MMAKSVTGRVDCSIKNEVGPSSATDTQQDEDGKFEPQPLCQHLSPIDKEMPTVLYQSQGLSQHQTSSPNTEPGASVASPTRSLYSTLNRDLQKHRSVSFLAKYPDIESFRNLIEAPEPSGLGSERTQIKSHASSATHTHSEAVAVTSPEQVRQTWDYDNDRDTIHVRDFAAGLDRNSLSGSLRDENNEGDYRHVEGVQQRIREEFRGMKSEQNSPTEVSRRNATHYNERSAVPRLERNTSSQQSLRLSNSSKPSKPLSSQHSPNSDVPQFAKSPFPSVLPTYMSAFEYAIRPFLSTCTKNYDHKFLTLSPSINSSSTSMRSTAPSPSTPSFRSDHIELLHSPLPPDKDLPSFLQKGSTLEYRIQYLTLEIALLRCGIIARLAEASWHNWGVRTDPYSPKLSGEEWRRHSHIISPTRSPAFPSDSSPNEYPGVYWPLYAKLHKLSSRIALPIAQRFEHQGLLARCLYWIGRAEIGLGNPEGAISSFESAELADGMNGTEGLNSNEPDIGDWLELARQAREERNMHSLCAEGY